MRYENGVKGCFVNNSIKGSFREIHSADIHKKILECFGLLFIFVFHGLDAHVRNVDVGNLGVALLEHLLTESRVARANVQDAMSLINVGGNDILESTKSLVPVEGFWVPIYTPAYLLYLSSQYSTFPY